MKSTYIVLNKNRYKKNGQLLEKLEANRFLQMTFYFGRLCENIQTC